MGTDCHIRVVGDIDPAWGQAETLRLERLWTRFADSEVTGIGPRPRDVDTDTALLLQRAIEGYDLTGGLFNPFLIDQLEAAGYDRDFDEISAPAARRTRTGVRPTVSVQGCEVSSTLPLDSGGLGKGLAADLIARRLLERGAEGALVNLGGDVRCLGRPARHAWQIGVEVPVATPEPITVKLLEGAVCTSTPLLRRWTLVTGGQAHHLIDPRTGQPMATDLASVTVIAPSAWLGEVLSKAVFLMDAADATALLVAHRAAALLVSRDGQLRRLG
jgi:thiamine biosynthesis lipoprotein